MTPPTLETLMAHADGALAPDEAARVETYLQTNPQARAQVEQFRRSGDLAAQAFAADLERPVPEALRRSVQELVAQARAQAARVEAGDVGRDRLTARHAAEAVAGRSAPARLLAWLGLDSGPRFGFAAAGVTFMAGVVGFVVGSSAPPPQTLLSASPMGVLVSTAEQAELARLLSTTPSGQRRELPTGGQVQLLATFKAAGGSVCREFALQRAADVTQAVACRNEERWGLTFAQSAPRNGGYLPAASPNAAIDAYVESIGGGTPMSPADEAKVLAER